MFRSNTYLILGILIVSFVLNDSNAYSQVRDNTFGFNGFVKEDFEDYGYGYDFGSEVFLQEDNKVLHFGSAQTHPTFGEHGIAMVRYDSSGVLDPTFDEDGIKIVRYNDSYNTYYSSAQLTEDQNILLAGQYSSFRFIQKYNPDGSVDETFADGGTLDFEDSGYYWDQHFIRVINENQFMLFRRSKVAIDLNVSYELSRYNNYGSLDLSYGDAGTVYLELPSDGDYFFSQFEIQDDESIVVSGSRTIVVEGEDDDLDLALMKINADGSLNVDFGTGGISTYLIAATSDMKVQDDGKIVCVGTTGLNDLGTTGSMTAVRFDSSGTIDPSFSNDGSISINISSYADYAKAVVIQPDGKIVIGGSFFNFGDGSVTDCALVRLMPDGSFDEDFGDGGVFEITLSSGTDQIKDIVLQDDDKLVFGGYGNYATFDMITVRIVTDGLTTSGNQNMCPNGSAVLTAFTDSVPIGWAWSGDPETIISDQLSVTVSPEESTTYFFYLENDTATVEVNILSVPVVNLPADTTMCIGETLVLDVTIQNPFYYYWGDETYDPIKTITEEGQYTIQAANYCYSAYDTINVFFDEAPFIDLGNDTILCDSDAILLGEFVEGIDYVWQDGSDFAFFEASENGFYWVDVTASCGTYRDSIELSFGNTPEVDLGEDFSLCQGEFYLLDATTFGEVYLWQDGSENATFLVEEEGEYSVVLEEGGCSATDSIYIDYIDSSSSINNITSCDFYESPSGDFIWNESGEYVDTLVNALGCDSILFITLDIPILDATITEDQSTLSIVEQEGEIQWFDCSSDWELIEGETGTSFEATESGMYGVEITNGPCSVVSECIEITIISVEENQSEEVQVFPNPAVEYIQLSGIKNVSIIEIYNVQMEFVRTVDVSDRNEIVLSISDLPSGMYWVRMISQEGISTQEIRFIIQ